MGYWSYILRKFPEIGASNVVARKSSASPATGYLKVHNEQQAKLIRDAFKEPEPAKEEGKK